MIRKWLACWVAGTLLFSTMPVLGQSIQALVGKGGRVQMNRGPERIAEFGAGVYNQQWVSADASADSRQDDTDQAALADPCARRGAIERVGRIDRPAGPPGTPVRVDAGSRPGLNSLQVSTEFAIPVLAGGRWAADGRSGSFPASLAEPTVFSGSIRSLTVELPAGGTLRWTFPEPTRFCCRTTGNGDRRSPCGSTARPVRRTTVCQRRTGQYRFHAGG
jgi:hypothetical protein